MVDREAYICAALRTPVGKHGGALAQVRADDLAAIPIKAVGERPGLDPRAIDDVILGCTNQAGEDNRNVARMALLLAGLPVDVPGQTVNRLCGSGLQAAASAAQAIKAGEGEIFIAGGVENMTRAPYVMLKPGEPWSRRPPEAADTTAGWPLANPRHRLERDQRRRGGPARGRTVGQSVGRTEASGADRSDCRRRRGSQLHGPGADSRDAKGPQARRTDDRSDRSRRAERGIRRSGDRLHARAHARPGEGEHLRRGDRAGPSPRRHGGADADDSRTRPTPYEVPVRLVYDVHRRGPGDRHGRGAGLMAAYEGVLVDIEEGIGTLTLNRPEKLNAFDRGMCRDLIDALRMLSGSDQVRVILLTGAGRGFCAGADLGTLAEGAAELVGAGREVPVLIRTAPQPVLAAVNGPAAGGGANLALGCDYRIASDQASIGQVFHKLGLVPDWGGSFFLPRLVGPAKALELVWSARMVPAAEALALGLFDRVVPHERLQAEEIGRAHV